MNHATMGYLIEKKFIDNKYKIKPTTSSEDINSPALLIELPSTGSPHE